jgi:Do/DeqQ family serine protease
MFLDIRETSLRAFTLIAALTLTLAAPAAAQETRRVPTDAVAMKASFAPVVRKAAPAVVNVFSRRVSQARTVSLADLFYNGGVPRERVEQSLGSGAIVRGDGIVVTNNHVVNGMSEIVVVLADRREYPATILLADPRSDLAVLKIDPGQERLPAINIDAAADVQVGDLVLAIGNPFGVGQTVTNGIVSALSRTDIGITDYSFFIQTDAAINPGNSGGPLVDVNGDLIGVNTAIFSRTGQSTGIGFAIPAAMVRQVVDSALRGQTTVQRPWFGARLQPITRDLARSVGLPGAQGVLVTGVYSGGPADRAGVQEGDVLLSVDGQPTNDVASVTYRIGTKREGDTAALRIRRDGADRNLTLRVALPPRAPADERTLSGRHILDGATVANLSPALAEEKGLDALTRGVVVTELRPGLASQRVGLRVGDVIAEVNGVAIDSTRRLQETVEVASRQWRVTIIRDGQSIQATFVF